MVTYESEYAALEQKYRAQVKLIAAFEQRVKALESENGNMDSMYQDRMLDLEAKLHKHYEAELSTLRAEIKSKVAERVAEFRAEVEGEMDALRAENERLQKAILIEREDCAKIAEKYEPDEKQDYITYASREIRSKEALGGGDEL
jgi:hypothetical protein